MLILILFSSWQQMDESLSKGNSITVANNDSDTLHQKSSVEIQLDLTKER